MKRRGSLLVDVSQDAWIDALPDRSHLISQGRVLDYLKFSVALGKQMLEAGFDTASVVNAVRGSARSFGVNISVSALGRTIIIRYAPSGRTATVITETADQVDGLNLHSMELLHSLILKMTNESWTLARCQRRLEKISEKIPAWPWWISCLGSMLLAASIALRTGSSPGGALLAAVTVFISDRISVLLLRLGVPSVFSVAGRAAVVAMLGLLIAITGLGTSAGAAAVIATGIVIILPIPALIQATADAVNHHYVSATSRISAFTVGGVMIMIGISLILGWGHFIERTGSGFADHLNFPWWVTILSTAAGGLGNALALQASPRIIGPAILVGALAGSVDVVLVDFYGAPAPLAAGLAAAVLGVVASAISVPLRIPLMELCMIGFTGALTPGADLQKAIDSYLNSGSDAGSYLSAVVATVVAIGVGMVFGTWLVRKFYGSRKQSRLTGQSPAKQAGSQ